MGSDDKDILGEEHAKIAGAEINSSSFARSRGLVTVAAPAAKRAALAMVSLETARLSHVTDALWLSVVGSWTSAALFRRPLMSVLASVYEVAPASAVKTGRPVLYSLSRAAAQELVLVSLLSPLASCDLAAPLKPDIYATDASELKGGYTVARAGVDIVRPLWRTASKKGGYSRLLSKEEAVLARFDDREPFDLRMQGSSVPSGPQRPLAYFFDFLEVSSCGLVSSLLADRGRAVGPVFSAQHSPFNDLTLGSSFEWVVHLLQHGRVKCLFCALPGLEPPPSQGCSGLPKNAKPHSLKGKTASCRDWPRSGKMTWGQLTPHSGTSDSVLAKDSGHLNTRRGALESRCIALMVCAWNCGVPALLLRLGSSVSMTGSEWLRLLRLGAVPGSSCFCAFGGEGCVDCKFLAFGLDPAPLSAPCCGCTSGLEPPAHQQPFLPYLLAQALATVFDSVLRRVSHVRSLQKLQPEGLESYVLNDIVLSLRWQAGDDWCWKSAAHINILEAASILRLVRALASSGPCRVVILVDSAVALHSCAKGRSPSRGLTPVLRKIAALCLIAGVFPAFHFVPARLNPGDCPTRNLPLPQPAKAAFWHRLSVDEVYEGLSLSKLRRWASNWARLVCLCVQSPPAFRPHLGWRLHHRAARTFDSTLGFPGEGPFFRVFLM